MFPLVRGTDAGALPSRHEERLLADHSLAASVLETADRFLDEVDLQFPWRTTIYCDTPDWRVYRATMVGAPRLRFREYHAQRPDRAFMSPTLWLEIKEEDPYSRKERAKVSPSVVPPLLRGDTDLPAGFVRLRAEALTLLAAGARPVVVTQYRRRAYAAPEDRLRITADYELSYLGITWPDEDPPAVPCLLGPVMGREEGIIIEIKWAQELPARAGELYYRLKEEAPSERPSKFMVGVGHLLNKGPSL